MVLAVDKHGPKSEGQGKITSGLNAGERRMLTKPAATYAWWHRLFCSTADNDIHSFPLFPLFPMSASHRHHPLPEHSQDASKLHSDE